jgi:hypothetical protein
MLTELFDREAADRLRTERPWLRVDISLCASLEYGKAIAMPPPATWVRWSREALARLERVEPLIGEGPSRSTRLGEVVLAWQGEPKVEAICNAFGELKLQSITLEGFQGIDLPRHFDDPDRDEDEPPHAQLLDMLGRVRAALYAWGEVMDHLR